jgi:DNA-binding MarR family transcriptional regulator
LIRSAEEARMTSEPQTIMDALRRIVQALRQSSSQSQDSANVTGAQALVLKHVAGHEGLSINDLAGLTFTHQSTVSEVVSRLEARGLLARVRAVEDGRRVELRLTAEGQSVAQTAILTAQEKLMQALQAMPPPLVTRLAQGLDALILAAGLSEEAPVMFFEPQTQKVTSK